MLGSAGCSSEKEIHENLSLFVKNVHKRLKKNYRDNVLKGLDADEVWENHCSDTQLLSKYASAMHNLAKGFWNESQDGNRITWCRKYIETYFYGGIMNKLRMKDIKRSQYSTVTESYKLREDKDLTISLDGKIRMLDVGSCYNPFKNCDDFCVVAIDLCPAVESVLQCDFIKLKVKPFVDFKDEESIESYLKKLGGHLESLPKEIFHVVIFSLFLDYLPSPEQRILSCVKAHSLLKKDGILIVICPDSRKQHRNLSMTRNWRTAIESVGFKRCTYEKLEHLHCMAFRKTSLLPTHAMAGDSRLDQQTELNYVVGLITIPQDNRESPEKLPEIDDNGIDFLSELPTSLFD